MGGGGQAGGGWGVGSRRRVKPSMGKGTEPLYVQKQPQCACQAKTVPGSSLTPHAALLVHPSGTIWTVMDLQGQKNAACESRPDYL